MLIWASTILAFHVAMGYMGYSKVLRYVILITPALIILFASLFYDAYDSIKQSANPPTRGLIVILGLSLASYAIEILTGIVHLLHPYNDLITPLIGGTLMMQ